MDTSIQLFSGSSHPQLAAEVAKHLDIELSNLVISQFANGEIYARPVNTVRGCDVFVVQTCTNTVNEDLMELFIILDALKRSFAGNIHVIMPHYGYARQDRVASPRESISAKLVADLISAAGADHVITMNLHSDQTQGFFDFPVDNLNSQKLFVDYFVKKKLDDLVVVSPDAGGAKNAKCFADALGANLVIIHKSRPDHNVSEVTHIVGEVEGRRCVLFDDMVDTGGSVCNAAKALKKHGAHKDMYLCATHPIFSDPAVERMKEANFKEVVVTNTLPIDSKKRFKGLTILSIAPFLAGIIQSVHDNTSVTERMYN